MMFIKPEFHVHFPCLFQQMKTAKMIFAVIFKSKKVLYLQRFLGLCRVF